MEENNEIGDEELSPSELATKEYWDCRYDRDVENFESHGDVGDIWFGEDSSLRVVRWMSKNIKERSRAVVDLGSGNGMLLIELAREGFTNLTGLDYSESAVRLASSIASNQQLDKQIEFKVVDLLGEDGIEGRWDVGVDKGTYDAISLGSGENRKRYISQLARLLSPQAILIITSCNWTSQELVQHFSPVFRLREVLPTPKFKFGGKEGNLVSSLVLDKI